MKRVLVTGAAGFVGYHAAERFLARGDEVVGLDNLNDYYDVRLKQCRLARLEAKRRFSFVKLDLKDRPGIEDVFKRVRPELVIHLAAQAGVRYSLTNPHVYVDSNITGFLHILEGCRQANVEHLVYASTSSVYGSNSRMPFSEHQNVDHPLTLYAATKKANELMAHSYSHLYGIPATGLRFFTVYGPWGRPDMALFLFTKAILEGSPIQVFNHGDMKRDFTYIDDIVEGVVRVADMPPVITPDWPRDLADPATSNAPWRVFNIGNSQPTQLLRYVEVIEECVGRKAQMEMLPMQPGDVPDTWADASELKSVVGYQPHTSIKTGVGEFVKWYREFYGA